MVKLDLLIAVSSLLSFSLAQTITTSSATTPTSTSAAIYTASSDWTYYGCWNETTLLNGTNGNRALSGQTEALDIMTVPICLDYCKSGGFSLAGLEYTRECYCADNLSGVSIKLPDSSCNLACEGNSSQICGGSLHLTVYSEKTTTKGAGIRGVRDAPLESILALGIAMGVLLCLA